MSVDSEGLHTLRRLAREAMRERGLLPEFSGAALRQTEELARAGAARAGGEIRDLRDLPWCSIDNDDSRDLDQLTVAENLADGTVRILVAVADVDALVAADSPIDRHASANTTSVYTVAEIFPMLPSKLSTDLTSLAAHRERLALVVQMSVDDDGAIVASDLFRGIVVNQAKLAYDSVAAWLEGRAAAPPALGASAELQRQLQLQMQVARRLSARRHRNGALSLTSTEPRAVFEAGRLLDLRPDTGNCAKEIIEDFMIAANGVVARFLAARRIPALRRVLRRPQRWERIVALAAESGDALPPEADAAALNAFLLRRRSADADGFPDLCLAVVKLLGRGEYAVDLPDHPAPGHFGLAVSDYAHATAPNRRFPDLITQRLVKHALGADPAPYEVERLAALAAHCTLQEDQAAKVERRIRKSAAALLLSSRLGERFNAVVTGAGEKGTWVRTSAPIAEGKLVRGFEGLDVGAHLPVVLVHTDVTRGYIDFERAD